MKLVLRFVFFVLFSIGMASQALAADIGPCACIGCDNVTWSTGTLPDGRIRIEFNKPGSFGRVAIRDPDSITPAGYFGICVAPCTSFTWGTLVNCNSTCCECQPCS
jgi:hypothetical protein